MRRVRRRGGNKDKVFGCDLLEHLNASSQEIPQVLRCCSEFVEHHGIVDGIYRLSGVSSNIQKLRGEFEGDGTPDLNKDLYLQDIHCVSSLCKAYFRELPNPLLTYQLYDKFAEAVAIQLEEERLVKIRDVLKELPTLHYRTLEFLMRHLVRMASYSSETNMHARNLAIVWAPNLLRSKDIEATGFNGTAAFMEVRVQSIVVEFILTHVPQLFPEQGVPSERRKSLPSPTPAANQDEPFFKHPVNFGNISPGDGPLPIRPYHAIIEGTDKRKGSLKGRKWMSIFNIGGRFHDPRRRQKNSSTKEKDRSALRPARSMDSLSTQSYPHEGPRNPSQLPPSTNTSPLITPSPQAGSEVGLGRSEYAVTYRRGTGLVTGGTQGTYTALDPEGLGVVGNEAFQSRSPGLSTKAGRRAAMHITGPTMVTVPLHITSNLALGVLQGRGSDRVIHRGRDKDGGSKAHGKEGEGKVEEKESRETEVEGGGKVREEETLREGNVDLEGEEKGEGAKVEEEKEEKEEEQEEARKDDRWKMELTAGAAVSSKQAKRNNSNTNDEDAANIYQDDECCSDYMDMKGTEDAGPVPADTQPEDVDASDVLNATEVGEDDQELFGYVQDSFEFLDHMDCSGSYQVHEFSVEPPGHSDDEYEVMEQAQDPQHPADGQTHQPHTPSQYELKPHRPLSLDLQSRHTKSLSLPYMTSPVHGPEESSSDEEDVEDDSDDDDDYGSIEEESMFMKSLPADFYFNDLNKCELENEERNEDTCTMDRRPVHETMHSEETTAQTNGDQEEREKYQDRLEEKQIMKKEEEIAHNEQEVQPEEHVQSTATEDDVHTMEEGRTDREKPSNPEQHCCVEFPLPSNDELQIIEVDEGDENVDEDDDPPAYDPPCHVEEESRELLCDGEETTEGHTEDGEDKSVETDMLCQEMALEVQESDENLTERPALGGQEGTAEEKGEEKTQEAVEEEDSAGVCGGGIWEQLEDVVCEVIEDEESELVQREAVAGGGDEQRLNDSGGEIEQVEGAGTDEREVRGQLEGQPPETTEEKLTEPEMQQDLKENETCLPETRERLEAIQGNNEAQFHDRDDVVRKEENEKGRCDERFTTCADKRQKEPEVVKVKCEERDSRQGGGGVGRKLVISKHPKVYQVKAVPIVPPKPQHCKLTALTLRQQQQQQQQQRDRGSREIPPVLLAEQVKVWDAAEHGRDGGGERWRERRDEGATRDTSRNSPLSMCFDEAVAIATLRRGKERECEKERQREWAGEV
ncbi:rho GTPase-activating protein 30 [Solea solea]|uniref:rho GTPase-activating protein 30 n=1 Tax=Solea solea TaxID=90069 RepID=UPI00272C7CF3|nr:rho GTPase-activating protein 30 [Solea solea]